MQIPTKDISPLKFIRLKNGDDLIAEISLLDTGTDKLMVKLVNPMKIIYMASSSGGINVGLMDWIFPDVSPVQEFYLDPREILVYSAVNPKLEQYYIKANLAAKKEDELTEEEILDHALEDEKYKDEDVSYIKDVLKEIKSGKRKLN